jgi:hypothetical protein
MVSRNYVRLVIMRFSDKVSKLFAPVKCFLHGPIFKISILFSTVNSCKILREE